MDLPGLIITGSSGFVGRHLVQALREDFRIFGIARRSQRRSGISPHPNVTWFQADIGERPQIDPVFRQIAESGGADTVIHLAAHYDFTGDEDPEYWRTNVIGLRHVLDASVRLGVKHFVFSSSVAACRIPRPGRAITEESPPHGKHIYAVTKREGEAMMFEYSDRLHPIIVRFAALFSDWCEYPPLFLFLETWLARVWNQRILGGQGKSAIPYLHISDLVLFLLEVLGRLDDLKPCEVLIASPDGCVSHQELFEASTASHYGTRLKPIHIPRPLCGPGMWGRDLIGRVTGDRPFERPWMAEYIDTLMTIDASRTRKRLDWMPRPRLEILRRMPFLIENKKTDPVLWAEVNRAAMKEVHVPTNLKVHWLLERHQDTIMREFTELLTGPHGEQRYARYQSLSPEQHEWHHRLVYRNLLNAVRTHDKGVFMGYCHDLAEQRLKEGYSANELCGALEALNLVCWRVLRRDPETRGMRQAIFDYVTSTLRSGCDQAQEVFELAEARRHRGARGPSYASPRPH
jgi:nucleoside-diphosphate-sugar epimerase